MASYPSRILASSGLRATLVPDKYQNGAFILEIEGTPQSHVFVEDNSELFFEYVRRIGHVIDLIEDPGKPLTALHLGGGALTLPRYIEATRPSSRQQVIEIEPDLIDFVREHLPLPRSAQIRIRYGDARKVLSSLPQGLKGNVDVAIVDIFSGATIPAHVTSVQFYSLIAPFMTERGVVIVNVADGPGLAFARSQGATLQAIFPHEIAIAETQVLKGRRFGNVVMVASRRSTLSDMLPRLLAAGPHPAKAVQGEEFATFMGTAPVIVDDTATNSPEPESRLFRMT